MPAPRLKVVVTRHLPEAVETRMSELFDVQLNDEDRKLTREELVAAMQAADVIVPCVTDQIDAAMLAQAGAQLKLIANYGAGVDHIDVATARQRGVLVTNTPGVMTDDTADMTMALILGVLRRVPEGQAVMQSGAWRMGANRADGRSRVGQTFGHSGHGPHRAGCRERGGLLECRCIITTAAGCTLISKLPLARPIGESLDQMVARMDVISVNRPHTPSTFHLPQCAQVEIDETVRGIVNTSRGK